MARAGTFNLVLRDDRYDSVFTASDKLHQRLKKVRAARTAAGAKNPAPTFADIDATHTLHLRARYKPYVATTCEYMRTKSSGAAATLGETAGTTATFTFQSHGTFTADMVFHVRFGALGSETAAASDPRYRFCAYPGMRLFERVEFKSASTLLDDYTADEVSFANKFEVAADRRAAWDRGMGQAPSKRATFFNENGFTGVLEYRDGLQTPKTYHAPADLWVPAQFAFNRDAAHALLNDLIPNSQRTVVVELATLAKLVQASDRTTGAAVALPISTLPVTIDLYVNSIFVNPEVADIFTSRIGYDLFRVHRRQVLRLTSTGESLKLSQLKYPLEYAYAGFRSTANADSFDQWHLFGKARARTSATSLLAATCIWNSTVSACQLACRTATEADCLDPVLSTLKFTAHGIDLYPDLPASFYSDYLPQRFFAGTLVTAAADTSALLVNFNLYPGVDAPSGYYNLSAGRELYLTYTAAAASSADPIEAVVSASALNFIVNKGDTCALRYSL